MGLAVRSPRVGPSGSAGNQHQHASQTRVSREAVWRSDLGHKVGNTPTISFSACPPSDTRPELGWLGACCAGDGTLTMAKLIYSAITSLDGYVADDDAYLANG